jgi:uncharacterized protein YdhG (YjbR/CyaY superfamily)
MRSDAKTVDEYLAALPPERRAVIDTVLDVVRRNMPSGYEEAMSWGVISWQVPLTTARKMYKDHPFVYASLAAQKNYYVVYLMPIMDAKRATAFEAAYRATGKRYDVGKCCVRFRSLDQLPLDLIGRTIAEIEVAQFLDFMERTWRRSSAPS